MATQARTRTKDLYEGDFYVWTEVQAALLRERRFAALDLANLIEEVEGLGDAKKSAVLNNTSVIIEHLLKLQHSPAQDPRRGWSESIIGHRTRLEIELTPRLRQVLEGELPRCRNRAPIRSSRSPATGGRRLAGGGGTWGEAALFA
jgi:Domain of unknown function DUF29